MVDAAEADAAAAAAAANVWFASTGLTGADDPPTASCKDCKPSPCFDFIADVHTVDIGAGGSDCSVALGELKSARTEQNEECDGELL
jgi:hypothetical protein